MESLIALLLGVGGVFGVIAAILFWAEEIMKVSALLWKVLAAVPKVFRGAHRRYLKLDLQGRVNSFTRGLDKKAPFLEGLKAKLEWVDKDLDRQAFLADGQVVLRLRREDPEDTNFVHAAYLFVSTGLLFKVKRYLSPSQRESIDLFTTTKLLEAEKPSVVGVFLDDYLHPKTSDTDRRVAQFIDTYESLDRAGLFHQVYLQELDFLGHKVFGARRDDVVVIEVNELVALLGRVADKQPGQDVDPTLTKAYCKFAIVMVGRWFNLSSDGEAYTRFIRRELDPAGIETVYLVGSADNTAVIDTVAESVSDTYHLHRQTTDSVLRHDGQGGLQRTRQYLVVLRRRGIAVVQPSK